MKLLFRDYLGSGRVFFSLFFFYRFEASPRTKEICMVTKHTRALFGWPVIFLEF